MRYAVIMRARSATMLRKRHATAAAICGELMGAPCRVAMPARCRRAPLRIRHSSSSWSISHGGSARSMTIRPSGRSRQRRNHRSIVCPFAFRPYRCKVSRDVLPGKGSRWPVELCCTLEASPRSSRPCSFRKLAIDVCLTSATARRLSISSSCRRIRGSSPAPSHSTQQLISAPWLFAPGWIFRPAQRRERRTALPV